MAIGVLNMGYESSKIFETIGTFKYWINCRIESVANESLKHQYTSEKNYQKIVIKIKPHFICVWEENIGALSQTLKLS